MSQVPQTFQAALKDFHAGRLAEAEKLFRQFLAEQPSHPDGLHMLGLIAFRIERYDAALDLIARAVQAAPNIAEYRGSLGMTLAKMRRYDEAMDVYRQALAMKPDYAEGHNNLGHALLSKRMLKEAGQSFETALMHKPNYVEAINNLGSVHQHLGDLEKAIELYRRAISLDSKHVATINNLAVTLKKKGELTTAINTYRQALEVDPNNAAVWLNLGLSLAECGRVEMAMEAYEHAIALAPNGAGYLSARLTTLHYLPDLEAEKIFEAHSSWAKRFADEFRLKIASHTNDRDPDRKLRVGYVSSDFREHSVANFIENLLANHDPANVELFAYADVGIPDETTARFKGYVANWRPINNVSDDRVAQMIREDRIDILVDLSGHASGNRILVFARKPAPIQIAYLGYPDTTGLAAMDYRLTDAFADPEGKTEEYHTEKLLRLPQCFLNYRPIEGLPEPTDPPAKKNGYVTFGCFNILPKINGKLMGWWAEILKQTPGSHLMIKSRTFSDAQVRGRYIGHFKELGIEENRLDLRVWTVSRREHMEMHQEVDIALDTYPYHGTTISFDALWMGVPLVTLAGPTHVSRVGVSLLSNLAMKKMIAKTPEEYVKIAVKQAADLDGLAQKRRTIRKKMIASPLIDARKFVPAVEAAYRQVWREWCAG